MFVNVDGALTSLSTSKDGSQVVVAGRNGEFLSDSTLKYKSASTVKLCLFNAKNNFSNFLCHSFQSDRC